MENKLPVAIIPIWVLYILASGSILEKHSVLAGSIMLVAGVVMAGYVYFSNKSGLKNSLKKANTPLHDIVFKYYIPFLLKYWKVVLACIFIGPVIFTILLAFRF